MVSVVDGGCGSEAGHKRRRTGGSSPPTDALTPARQRRSEARHRKQKLISRLSDSGFQEDLGDSPVPSPTQTHTVSPLRVQEPAAGQQPSGSWFLQYGDIGFRVQREREEHFHPCRSLARQPQLTAEARCKLVSWLIPVHRHFRLSFECCCLAVNIMDRFLASTAVAADCFQLLGVTALLLATKQVEVGSPRISHLLSLCCDAFTKEQLCNLECLILLRLNYRLAAPTLAFFMDYYHNCMEAAQNEAGGGFARRTLDTKRPKRCSDLARKVCELSLADYAFNKYPASLTASCALRLASELLKTEQGLTIQSGEDQWDSFVDEPCVQSASSERSVAQEGHNHNLARECKDNLKMLVSLNQEKLNGMSNM